MRDRKSTCDSCGAEIEQGSRTRLIVQEEGDGVDYWRNRIWRGTGKSVYLCKKCCMEFWEEVCRTRNALNKKRDSRS